MISQLKDQWRITLDDKLLFTNCINDEINKTFKGVGLPRKLSTLLPPQKLAYFIRPNMDYGNVIHDQPLMNLFPTE